MEVAAASGEELEMSLNLEDCPRENPEGKNPVSGELTVATKWMPLSFTADGATLAVLTLFVYSCNTLVSSQTESGIPEEVSVSVSVTNQPSEQIFLYYPVPTDPISRLFCFTYFFSQVY